MRKKAKTISKAFKSFHGRCGLSGSRPKKGIFTKRSQIGERRDGGSGRSHEGRFDDEIASRGAPLTNRGMAERS